MGQFFQQFANGIAQGSVYALIGMGVTLVFGLTRLINFAHGEFLAIGAMTLWALSGDGWGFWVNMPIAVVLAGAIAFVVYRVGFKPTLDVPLNGFILSLGLITIDQAVLSRLVGVNARTTIGSATGVAKISSVIIPWNTLLVIVITLSLTVGLIVILSFTNFGRIVRATSEDSYAASLIGIQPGRIIALIFVVGSALAALAGAFISTVFALTPYSGVSFVLYGFIVAILGGLGNPTGAAVAGFGLGVIQTLTGAYVSLTLSGSITYVLLVVALAIRPTGLFRTSSV
jgi:branched-chain amino acid transport system permease protein